MSGVNHWSRTLAWLMGRASVKQTHHEPVGDSSQARARAMAGAYAPLYRYLEGRFADTVVLTFAEIEDLLGFTLPDAAHRGQEWWTRPAPAAAGPMYEDSWILARRTATPHLSARTVAFERVS